MSEPHDSLLPDIEPAHIRAVFFDLDGTLLPMDLDEFIQSYFCAIGAYVDGQGLDVDAFSAGFARGMRKMAHHDPAITNCQAFWNEFFQWADAEAYDWQTILLRFYSEEFPLVGKDVVPNPASARVVQLLVEKGYPVVLATMPYFPLPAVEERLGWANVDKGAFARITHYENSRASKPDEFYYAEQLVACGLRADEVLMVGNNTVEDGSFAQMGAHLYLATDWLLNPNGITLDDVPHGSMAEFATWVEQLPDCENPATDIARGLVDEAACHALLA